MNASRSGFCTVLLVVSWVSQPVVMNAGPVKPMLAAVSALTPIGAAHEASRMPVSGLSAAVNHTLPASSQPSACSVVSAPPVSAGRTGAAICGGSGCQI